MYCIAETSLARFYFGDVMNFSKAVKFKIASLNLTRACP